MANGLSERKSRATIASAGVNANSVLPGFTSESFRPFSETKRKNNSGVVCLDKDVTGLALDMPCLLLESTNDPGPEGVSSNGDSDVVQGWGWHKLR